MNLAPQPREAAQDQFYPPWEEMEGFIHIPETAQEQLRESESFDPESHMLLSQAVWRHLVTRQTLSESQGVARCCLRQSCLQWLLPAFAEALKCQPLGEQRMGVFLSRHRWRKRQGYFCLFVHRERVDGKLEVSLSAYCILHA